MPASSLLVVVAAAAAALEAPRGFQTVPIDGKTQVMVARKGDVYFVVRDLPGVLGAKAKPRAVATRLITEASGILGAEWTEVRGIDVIAFTWGDEQLGAQGLIGAHGTRTRVATCQWGVGLKPSPPAERMAAIDACTMALTYLPGLEAPPATGGAPEGEGAAQPGEELPFAAPAGFEWRSDGAGGWLGMRGGSAEKGGGEAMGAYELPIVFDTRMDLSRVTDEVADVVAEGLKLESLEVTKLAAVDTIHFHGRVGAGATGAAVEGFLVPRGRTTFLVFVMKQAAVPPELSASLRAAAESVEGIAAPAVDSKPPAPDAGVPDTARKKAAPAKKDAGDWKGAVVVVSFVALAIGLAVAMGLGRSRRRRRRAGTAPPDPTPPA